MFQYDQNSGVNAGGAVRETGAYVGRITAAVYGASANKGTKFIELTFESNEGTEFNYLTLYYAKQDGTEVKGGASMINAIMGITKTRQLTEQKLQGVDGTIAPELIGKPIGLILQKVLYTKGDGSEGYKFEIRLPFSPQTRQTLKELVENKPAQMVDRILSTLTDKDDRGGNQQSAPQQFGGVGDFAPPSGAPAPNTLEVPDDAFDNW